MGKVSVSEMVLMTVRGMIRGAGAEINKETDEGLYVDIPKGCKLDDDFMRSKMKAFMKGAGVTKKFFFKIV